MKKIFITSSILLCSTALSGCSNLINLSQDQPIEENYGFRATGDYIDDEIIEVKAKVNLLKEKEEIQGASVSVTSFNGIVLLTGQAPTEETRMLAERIVASIRKVKRIHNEIQIAGSPSTLNSASDTWVTLKAKSLLLTEKNTPGYRIKVVTESSTVYLMGLVTRAEAEFAVETIRNSSGVQKVVKIFEYID